jgi:hypothetical protein
MRIKYKKIAEKEKNTVPFSVLGWWCRWDLFPRERNGGATSSLIRGLLPFFLF